MDYRESRNLTHQLAQSLGIAVIEGKYTNEAGVPTEATLCEEYGVSRTATREAVKMLTAKGIISSRPRQGIRICPETEWNMFDTDLLQWILHSEPSFQLLKEFTEMRMAFEPEAAKLAARKGTENELVKIESALNRMVKASQGLDDPLDSDIAFHTAIMYASNNRFFVHLRSFVSTALRVSIRLTNKAKGTAGGDIKAHRAVYEAIRNRDEESASALMKEMLSEVMNLIHKAEKMSNDS